MRKPINKFNKSIIGAILAVLSMLMLVSCVEEMPQGDPTPTPAGSPGPTATPTPGADATPPEGQLVGETQELKKFSSSEELVNFLKSAESESETTAQAGSLSRGFAADVVMESDASMKNAAPMAEGASGYADSYSKTNVQVENVDEADFIKNDNKYIYMLVENKLVIANAYPAEDAEILSTKEIEGSPYQILLNEDRVVVFARASIETIAISQYDYVPRTTYKSVLKVILFDVSDREDPQVVNEYIIDGNFYQARMIGDHVYFIAKDYVYYYYDQVNAPKIVDSDANIVRPEIYYFDNPESDYIFHTVASLNIQEDEDNIEAKTFMMGYSNSLYVSEDNIYISYQKNRPYWYWRNYNEDRFYEVVLPLLPEDVQDEINELEDDMNYREKWQKLSDILTKMYNEMEDDDKEDLIQDIEEAIADYEAKQAEERSKTVIHKIAIDDGDIEYEGKGIVKGYLNNQFSLDEHKGNLRVATTVNTWTRKEGRETYNNVYVLDEDMEQIGEIENIAPDETIYSTRFMGDRLYMVTYRQIDPFFVIDLSDPEEPEILGQLKIPGFSDYMQAYDEDHIFGIGRDGTESGRTGGIKISLYDVSDVENPKEVDKYVIGDDWSTSSEANNEHKAVLFDREKNLLVIPVQKRQNIEYYEGGYTRYKYRTWQGAYVFRMTYEEIEKEGQISHFDGETDYSYYSSPYNVRRALFMDDVLYTVSMKKILMNSLDDIDEELGELSLPYSSDYYYPYYYY